MRSVAIVIGSRTSNDSVAVSPDSRQSESFKLKLVRGFLLNSVSFLEEIVIYSIQKLWSFKSKISYGNCATGYDWLLTDFSLLEAKFGLRYFEKEEQNSSKIGIKMV